MSALVLFTDQILYICDIKDVIVYGKQCSAKFNDNKKYAVRVLAISNCVTALEIIKLNIDNNVPIDENWVCTEISPITFKKASKQIINNAEVDLIFLDKSILPKTYMDKQIQSFTRKNDLCEQNNFFGKSSYFIQVERKKLNSSDTVTFHGNEHLTIEKTKSVIPDPLALNQTYLINISSNFNDESVISQSNYSRTEGEISFAVERVNSSEPCKVQLKNNERIGISTTPLSSPETNDLKNVEISSNLFNISDIGQIPFMYEPTSKIMEKTFTSTENNDVQHSTKRKLFVQNNNLEFPSSNSNVSIFNDALMIIDPELFKSNQINVVEAESSENNETINIDIDPFKNNVTLTTENFVMYRSIENNVDHAQVELFNKPRKSITKIIDDEIELSLSKQSFKESSTWLFPGEIDYSKLEEPKLHSTMYDSPNNYITTDGIQINSQNVTISREFKNLENRVDSDESYKLISEEAFDNIETDDNWTTDDEEFELKTNKKIEISTLLNITLGDNPQSSAPDDRSLYVDVSSTSTKKHFCMYCKKFQSKLARHLQFVHANEEDVKKFISLPPRSQERQQIISTIRKNGDYIYNTDKRYNDGKLIVCRRPNSRMSKIAEDFTVCGNCKGQYTKSVLRHHWKRCTKRDGKHQRIIMVKGRKVAARLHEKASLDVRKYIFPYMREDEVVRGIRYDELLTLFANKQCEKYGTHQHLYQMIRARLRLLGRFLNIIKSIADGIENFSDLYKPRFYDATITAVRVVAGFMPEKKIFTHPSVASNLGTLLKQVGELLRSEYIKNEMPEAQKKVEDYLKLLSEDFGISINRVVAETQTQANRRKEILLPTTEDIKKLHDFIITERNKYFSQLSQTFSFEAWQNLAKTTLIYLQIFNRRRPGEIERLYLEDFKSYRGIDKMADPETYNTLSDEGKRLARKYVRFEIRGKRGRGVPVLIDNNVLKCLNLLVEYRRKAGVSLNNPYLFGLPSHDKDRFRYLRACNLMREYSSLCGAAISHTLRGTQLRKHIATKCINLNLTNGQVEDLANFMGHDQKIHKGIYRQPVLQTDIVNIAKILNTAQGANECSDSDDDEEDGADGTQRNSILGQNSSKRFFGASKTKTGKDISEENTQSFIEFRTPKRWSGVERDTVLSAFKQHLENNKIPSGKEIENLINNNDCLKGRTVPQLRSWLHNQKQKM